MEWPEVPRIGTWVGVTQNPPIPKYLSIMINQQGHIGDCPLPIRWRKSHHLKVGKAFVSGHRSLLRTAGTKQSQSRFPNLGLTLHPYPAWRKLKLPGDSSLMTYRGHGVLHTLIRCRFSPIHSTGQQFIYSGCSTGKVVGKDCVRTRGLRKGRNDSLPFHL